MKLSDLRDSVQSVIKTTALETARHGEDRTGKIVELLIGVNWQYFNATEAIAFQQHANATLGSDSISALEKMGAEFLICQAAKDGITVDALKRILIDMLVQSLPPEFVKVRESTVNAVIEALSQSNNAVAKRWIPDEISLLLTNVPWLIFVFIASVVLRGV